MTACSEINWFVFFIPFLLFFWCFMWLPLAEGLKMKLAMATLCTFTCMHMFIIVHGPFINKEMSNVYGSTTLWKIWTGRVPESSFILKFWLCTSEAAFPPQEPLEEPRSQKGSCSGVVLSKCTGPVGQVAKSSDWLNTLFSPLQLKDELFTFHLWFDTTCSPRQEINDVNTAESPSCCKQPQEGQQQQNYQTLETIRIAMTSKRVDIVFVWSA